MFCSEATDLSIAGYFLFIDLRQAGVIWRQSAENWAEKKSLKLWAIEPDVKYN